MKPAVPEALLFPAASAAAGPLATSIRRESLMIVQKLAHPSRSAAAVL